MGWSSAYTAPRTLTPSTICHQQSVDVRDDLALDRATGPGGPTDSGSGCGCDPPQVADKLFDWRGRHEASRLPGAIATLRSPVSWLPSTHMQLPCCRRFSSASPTSMGVSFPPRSGRRRRR